MAKGHDPRDIDAYELHDVIMFSALSSVEEEREITKQAMAIVKAFGGK
jgi:hypothetical protein